MQRLEEFGLCQYEPARTDMRLPDVRLVDGVSVEEKGGLHDVKGYALTIDAHRCK